MYPLVGRLDRNRRTLGLVRISIHAPLAGCDAGRGRFCRRREDFNPRTSCGVRQFCQCRQRVYVSISIHAPLAGCDDGDFRVGFFLDGISIHAPLAGCDECDSQQRYERLQISIHAPLAGCDHGGAPVRIPVPISIHAPLAGCDTATLTWQRSYEQFQSTHPLRGATQVLRLTELLSLVFQSTHPMRGATPRRTANRSGFPISIHAPLAGCDARRTAH